MFNRALTVLLAGASVAAGDVIQLKDKASVNGRILAEKRDLLVVDVGYTVLTIPRSAVAHVTRDAEPEPKTAKGKTAPPPASTTNTELFRSTRTLGPEKSVREL